MRQPRNPRRFFANAAPAWSKCRLCHHRYQQAGCAGLCRRCFAEECKVEQLRRAITNQAIVNAANAARLAGVPAAVPSTGRKTVIVAGVEYLVMWDGSMDGAAAMGLPLAHERGRDYFDKPGPRRGL